MRLFVGPARDSLYQLLTLSQNRGDSSIYFSAPLFEQIEWRLPIQGADGKPGLLTYHVPEEGKLSVHGSGMVHAKAHGVRGSNEFAVKGNILRSDAEEKVSVRHLLTLFPAEPKHKPASRGGERKTDGWLTGEPFRPMVLIFWAVPRQDLTAEFSHAFHADEIESPTTAFLGLGAWDLETHALVCVAYRTNHMDRWPAQSQACYFDGHAVPLFIGTGPGELSLELTRPNYTLEGKRLRIEVHSARAESERISNLALSSSPPAEKGSFTPSLSSGTSTAPKPDPTQVTSAE